MLSLKKNGGGGGIRPDFEMWFQCLLQVLSLTQRPSSTNLPVKTSQDQSRSRCPRPHKVRKQKTQGLWVLTLFADLTLLSPHIAVISI